MGGYPSKLDRDGPRVVRWRWDGDGEPERIVSVETDGNREFFTSAQTHTAVVLMFGEHAFKIKKPVDLGFLDFTRRETRKAVSEREVELNRRLAPDVYLGVADVLGPDGNVCDHLVVMRRMPTERRLSTMVCDGSTVEGPLRGVARQLAALHTPQEAGPDVQAEGSVTALRRRWTASFDQLRPLRGRIITEELTGEIETLTYEFLNGRECLFASRIAGGYIVDGHGDLLADDIFCLDDGPRILDCLEFDDRLRWVDGLDDAAFLAMDLEYLGSAGLATRFLNWYAEFAADPAPAPLRHHFIAYRAFVRAKVACLRHLQGEATAAATAQQHAELAATHLRDGVVRLAVIGGLPGTGKSTLSVTLADRLPAMVVSSDRVRKELAGLPVETGRAVPYQTGIYSPERTDQTYQEMINRAERLLAMGESVLLDASWSRHDHRELARQLARRTHSRLVELRCETARDVAAARMRERTHATSDADDRIAAALAADADSWPEALTVQTGQSLDGTVESAVRIIRAS